MAKVEQKLGSVKFWLSLGIANHLIGCVVVIFGCIYSDFTCSGDSMSSVISAYTFTLFTPQVAAEVILLLALFLINDSFRRMVKYWRLGLLFLVTIVTPVLLVS